MSQTPRRVPQMIATLAILAAAILAFTVYVGRNAGGDPKGDGTGGPGYQFKDEPVGGEYTAGAVAMANSGPNTNGSQFFICTVDDSKKLQKLYNLFGYVQSGMDVVLKIAVGDVMTSVTVQEETG